MPDYTSSLVEIPFSDASCFHIEDRLSELPDGEIRRLHHHTRLELGICTSGTGLFVVDGAVTLTEPLTAGDALLIPPGVRHYSRSIDGQCLCRFCYVDLTAVGHRLARDTEKLLKRIELPPILRADDSSSHRREAHAMLCRLLGELERSSSRPLDEELASLRLLELLLCCRDWFGEAEPQSPPSDPAVAAAVNYICLHYAEPITSDELAAQVYLSKSQLRRRFNSVIGIPPIEYLQRLRCQIGAQLLIHTRLPISEIARRVGLESSDFYRHFRRLNGRSPTDWRARFGQSEQP